MTPNLRCAIALSVAVAFPLSASGGDSPLPVLLDAVASDAAPALTPAGRPARRARLAQPDLDAIATLATRAIEKSEAPRFAAALFPGFALTGTIKSAERRASGGTTLIAQLDGVELGTAVITVESGRTFATFSYAGGQLQLSPQADGSHLLIEAGPDSFPPEAAPRRVFGGIPKASVPFDGQALDVPQDSGRVIDVMILWTPQARTAAGSLANIQARVQAGIDEANATYLNSGIAQRLRLVHSAEVVYTERTGNCPDAQSTNKFDCALEDLTTDGDGRMDIAHDLRDQYGADLVALLIADNALCGIAWIPDFNPNYSHAPWGFSVTGQGCIGNGSFTHELGHNMGADHDPAYALPGGAQPYNHGYVSPQQNWRTVMAYPYTCNWCPSLFYFSNPNLSNGGVAMGTALQHNNALLLNKTAKAVANYRATASPPGPQPAYFNDVPIGHPMFGQVQFMAQAAYTSGCAAGLYCPTASITRRHMAGFIERVKRSAVFAPPAAVGLFGDVPPGAPFAGFIEALYNDGITSGCGSGNYCPDAPIIRAHMAKFILKAKCGGAYTPGSGPETSPFTDVWTSDPFYPWIYKLYALGITSGCGPTTFCPTAPVTRAQMATFLERAFPFGYPTEACSL